jgi:hypothetical protein
MPAIVNGYMNNPNRSGPQTCASRMNITSPVARRTTVVIRLKTLSRNTRVLPYGAATAAGDYATPRMRTFTSVDEMPTVLGR